MRQSLACVDQGVIFRNPRPGHHVVNAFLPFVHVVAADHWLSIVRTGGAFYSSDGMIELFASHDEGRTWLRRGPLCDRAEDEGQFNYREGCMTTLRDGRLLVRLTRVRHDNADDALFNPATRGMLPRQTCFLTSDDLGATWSRPVVANLCDAFGEGVEPVPAGATIVMRDGRWFQSFESWKTYDNAGPFQLQTYGLFSTDEGRTWQDRVTIADGQQHDRSYSHGRPIALCDGRLLTVLWTADAQQNRFHDLHAVRSIDAEGEHWEQPRPLGIPGQTNWPVDMGDGRVLLVYCQRENTSRPGIKAVLSVDEGQTWDMRRPVEIWDAYGREALGVAPTSRYPSSHDVIAYGAPQVTRLDDDEAIVSFWCTLGPDTHCRWCRVKIQSHGDRVDAAMAVSSPAGAKRGGVVAAAITPCTSPGEIDCRSMTRYTAALIEGGCDGVFVCGSTGELPLLDEDERRALIAAARAGCSGSATLYAGVSGMGLGQTLRHARHAADAGADVAVIMAPFFLRLSQEELLALMLAMADDSPIPVAVYHHLRMPTPFEVDTIARLAEHPNIVAVKDTSQDAERLKQLVTATSGRGMLIFQGSEPMILSSLDAGAHGCVAALAGIAPQWHAALIAAWRGGEHEAAERWQQRISDLWRIFQLAPVAKSFGGFVGALKVVAQHRGWITSAAGMSPAFVPDDALRSAVLAHLTSVAFDA